MSDALVDFTSGVSEVIDLEAKSGVLRSAESEEKKALFKSLVDEIEDHALMCAAIRVRISIIYLLGTLNTTSFLYIGTAFLSCYRLLHPRKWRNALI